MSDEERLKLDPNQKGGLWDFAFNGIIIPELQRRIDCGELPNPFPLSNLLVAQVLFRPNGKQEVRINSQVKVLALIEKKPGKAFKKGDPVMSSDITALSQISLPDEDADCGHVTFFQGKDSWTGSFDFGRYKGKSRNHLSVARQYISAAQNCLKEKQWAVFIDNLWAAAELTAKAYLFWLNPTDKIVKTKKHKVVHGEINRQRKNGNVQDDHVETFNELSQLRDKLRYAETTVDFDDAKAAKLLNDVISMADAVDAIVKDRVRNPDSSQ